MAALRLLSLQRALDSCNPGPEVRTKLGFQGWVLLNLAPRRSHKWQGCSHFGCVRP